VTSSATVSGLLAQLATADRWTGRSAIADETARELEKRVALIHESVTLMSERLEAAEDTLSAAFVVGSPRVQPTSAAAAEGTLPVATASPLEAEAAADEGPSFGIMVPVAPSELLTRVEELAGAVAVLSDRLEALEEAGEVDDVRAGAAEAVLDAMPRAFAEQLAELRAELSALLNRPAAAPTEADAEGSEASNAADSSAAAALEAAQEARLAADAASQAAAAVSAVLAAVTASAEAASAAREAASSTALDAIEQAVNVAANEASAAARAASDARAAREAVAEAAATAVDTARQAAVEAAVLVSRDAVAVAMQRRTGGAAESSAHPALSRLVAEVQALRDAVGASEARFNDLDELRDQLQALAERVREAAETAAAASPAVVAAVSEVPDTPAPRATPSTPMIPMGVQASSDAAADTVAAVASLFTPAASALPAVGGRTPRASVTGHAFLARLVEVVKGQSSRLHAQYSDAEEGGAALQAVDANLDAVEAKLQSRQADVADVLVTVLDSIAALRAVGSTTHPALQQLVLQHESRLEEVRTCGRVGATHLRRTTVRVC
jgi:hypothetical protein